jgi:cysteine desulfurase
MHANNETGVIQPVADIARLAHGLGIAVHSDAAQSAGKIGVGIDDLGVDLLTIAGHKLYATKGIGALVVRRGTRIAPWLLGGGQERGLRSGTENVPGIASLGVACALARSEALARFETMRVARDRLEHGLRSRYPDLVVHGAGAQRLPNTLSAAIPNVFGDALVARLPGVALSTGAACHAGASEPSRVLLAMGVPPRTALCTLRLSTGRTTTCDEIDEAVARIAAAAERLV